MKRTEKEPAVGPEDPRRDEAARRRIVLALDVPDLEAARALVARVRAYVGAVKIGKELFTTADNYLFEIGASVVGPLRALALASAVGVDLALKQDDR